MKKILYLILIVFVLVGATGCGNKIKDNQNKNNVKQNVEEKVNENINIVGFYGDWKNVTGYDDYVEFKADGSFFRQVNLSYGYQHYTGVYEIVKHDNKDAVKITVKEIDKTIYFEVRDDTLIYMGDENEYNEFIGFYSSSTWRRLDASEIEYWDEFQHDGADFPEEY